MKRTYIKPQTRQVYMHAHKMIAASNPTLNMVTDKKVKGSEDVEILSRENDSFWDDEEEDW